MSRWKVTDVMTTDVVSVGAEVGFRELVDVLSGRGVSAVPVVDDAKHVIGLVSEADLLHKMEFAGESVAARLLERHRRRAARQSLGFTDIQSDGINVRVDQYGIDNSYFDIGAARPGRRPGAIRPER